MITLVKNTFLAYLFFIKKLTRIAYLNGVVFLKSYYNCGYIEYSTCINKPIKLILYLNTFNPTSMKKTLYLFANLLSISTFYQSNLIADGATPQLVSSEFAFTEGPAADKKGNIFFTDQPNDRIWKYDTEGKLSVFMDKSGRSNGLYFDKKGNLWACADEKNQLWEIDKNKNYKVWITKFEEKLLNGPNDLWIDTKGGIYFTDPFYKRPYWKNRGEEEQPQQRIYYFLPDRSAVKVVADGFVRPNGIIGNVKNNTLYVADIGGSKTYRFQLNADGSLTNKTLFCEMGSDGMTIDNLGNVYLTGKGVTVFDSSGKQIEHIDIPEPWTANVTFGGKKRNILFITASKSVYTLQMKVKGLY